MPGQELGAWGHGSAAAGLPGRKLSGKTSEPAVCVFGGVGVEGSG